MKLLFGYKVLKDGLCGFPDNSLSKVLNTLEDAKISYQIIEVDKNPIIKDLDKLNNYQKYLDLALKNLDKRKRLDYLIDNYKLISSYKVEINSLINTIDYIIERLFIKGYIVETSLKKVSYKLSEINRMCNKWLDNKIDYDSKNK